MATKHKTIKDSTYKKILSFKEEFKSVKEFKKSDKYTAFANDTFLNSVEKEFIDEIIEMVYAGNTYDDVKEFVNQKMNEKIDEVFDGKSSGVTEEAESIFMASVGKVIEVGPVDVIVPIEDESNGTNITDEVFDTPTDDKKDIKPVAEEVDIGAIRNETFDVTPKPVAPKTIDENSPEAISARLDKIWGENLIIIKDIVKDFLNRHYKHTKITQEIINAVTERLIKGNRYNERYRYTEITDYRKSLIESTLEYAFRDPVLKSDYRPLVAG